MVAFTILEPNGAHEIDARIDGERIIVGPDDIAQALGWLRKPEGICRDEVCIPVHPDAGLDTADGLDLAVLARLLGRPLAIDIGERVAFVGESASTRAQALSSLVAPDFSLPDLDGRMHSLSEQRGKKVFLVAWASW